MSVAQEERSYFVRYRDAFGFLQELNVTRADALAIRRIRAKHHRDQEKWRAKHVALTDLSTIDNPEQQIEDGSRRLTGTGRVDQEGLPWEGPRYSFAHLLGESRTWRGEPVVDGHCTFCHGLPLGEETLCLGCTRSGKDDLIPKPSKADLAKRKPPAPKNDGLKGGTGR